MAIVLSRYSGNAWILCISYLFCVKRVLVVASAELTISWGTAVLSFDSGDSFGWQYVSYICYESYCIGDCGICILVFVSVAKTAAKMIYDRRAKIFRDFAPIQTNMSRPEHQAPPEIVCCIFILGVGTDCCLVLWRYRGSEIHFKVKPFKSVPNLSSRIQQVQAEMVCSPLPMTGMLRS